jgi:hypothetical protein
MNNLTATGRWIVNDVKITNILTYLSWKFETCIKDYLKYPNN